MRGGGVERQLVADKTKSSVISLAEQNPILQKEEKKKQM